MVRTLFLFCDRFKNTIEFPIYFCVISVHSFFKTGTFTDAQISLHTLLVKYDNGLLGRQSSEWGRDEVTFFYVGDLFLYTPWH